mgnify:CR=1 FL=1
MLLGKQFITDLLFGVQVVLAVIFGYSQVTHMLQNGADGVSIGMWTSFCLFAGLNLGLAIKANKVYPDRNSQQNIFVYGLWVLIAALNATIILVKSPGWDRTDTTVVILLLFGTLVIGFVAKKKHLNIRDPMIRGWLALLCKAMPQLAQAWKIVLNRGAPGFSPAMVWLGHATILVRLAQLGFAVREAGWDKNRRASLLSEIGNELSWIIVTIIWLMY